MHKDYLKSLLRNHLTEEVPALRVSRPCARAAWTLVRIWRRTKSRSNPSPPPAVGSDKRLPPGYSRISPETTWGVTFTTRHLVKLD